MAAPQQTGCYKCGALDHVATNRNCPRPRKPSAVTAAAPAAPPPAPDRDAKFIKHARLGDDTRFWFYTEDETSSSDEVTVKQEKGEDEDKNKWKMSDPVLRAAFAVKPGVSPVKVEKEKKKQGKQPIAPPKKLPKKPEKKQRGAAKSVVRKKPVAKPRKPITTINAAGDMRQTKPLSHPATAIKPHEPSTSSSSLTEQPVSSTKQEPKPTREGPLGTFNGIVITQEYLDWCDRPENNPFARQNWEGMMFNNMGECNTVRGFNRVRYQRGVQGWRECRSLGGGLGRPFP